MEILVVIVFYIALKILSDLNAPKIKGKLGEGIVSRELKNLPVDNYTIINDLTIKNGNKSSQIDHVVICNSGIIVIETKFLKGWIFGNEETTNWTQVIYNNKFRLFNPIKQNKGHINALKYKLPQFSNIPYYSIVVLAGSCEFKSFDDVNTPVIYPDDLIETVNSFSGNQVLTQKNILDIETILNSFTSSSKESKKEHIVSVRNKKRKFNTAIDRGMCPICGGTLVNRDGKYGNFWGCNNFPRCRFTIGSE